VSACSTSTVFTTTAITWTTAPTTAILLGETTGIYSALGTVYTLSLAACIQEVVATAGRRTTVTTCAATGSFVSSVPIGYYHYKYPSMFERLYRPVEVRGRARLDIVLILMRYRRIEWREDWYSCGCCRFRSWSFPCL